MLKHSILGLKCHEFGRGTVTMKILVKLPVGDIP